MSLKFREMSMKKLQFQTTTRLIDDIIIEVINHLPVISNFRFKCVSKQWFSLNSEALKRRSQTLTMSGIFYVTNKARSGKLSVEYANTQKGRNEDSSSIDGTLSFLPKHGNMRIYGSCNGLLLCEGWDERDCSIYVCNPTTRKWIKIPYGYTGPFLVIMLDFNPLVSVHFNVITIRSCDSHLCQYAFEVFSSKTGEWKVSQVTNRIFRECKFLHFATSTFKGLIFCINRGNTHVIGFDMEGNCRRRIELPGKSHPKKDAGFFSSLGPSSGSLCQLGGCLHYYYKSENELYVWKLVDYESGSCLLKNSFPVKGSLKRLRDLEFKSDLDDILFIGIHDKMQATHKIALFSLDSPICYFPYSPCYWVGFGNKVEKNWVH